MLVTDLKETIFEVFEDFEEIEGIGDFEYCLSDPCFCCNNSTHPVSPFHLRRQEKEEEKKGSGRRTVTWTSAANKFLSSKNMNNMDAIWTSIVYKIEKGNITRELLHQNLIGSAESFRATWEDHRNQGLDTALGRGGQIFILVTVRFAFGLIRNLGPAAKIGLGDLPQYVETLYQSLTLKKEMYRSSPVVYLVVKFKEVPTEMKSEKPMIHDPLRNDTDSFDPSVMTIGESSKTTYL